MKHLKKLFLVSWCLTSLSLFAADKQQSKDVERNVEVKEREEKHAESQQHAEAEEDAKATEHARLLTATKPLDVVAIISGFVGPYTLKRILPFDHVDEILAWNEDGSLLVAGDNKIAALWNTATWQQVRKLEPFSWSWTKVSGVEDGFRTTYQILWDDKTTQSFGTFRHSTADDDMRVMRNRDGSIFVAPRGAQAERIVLQDSIGLLTETAFSFDGTLLAAGFDDGIVKIWNAQTGHLLTILEGHKGAISKVAWSPDGTQLASSSAEDKAIRIWGQADLTGVVRQAQKDEKELLEYILEELRAVDERRGYAELRRLRDTYPELYKRAFALYQEEVINSQPAQGKK